MIKAKRAWLAFSTFLLFVVVVVVSAIVANALRPSPVDVPPPAPTPVVIWRTP
jgi:hypothetical protein